MFDRFFALLEDPDTGPAERAPFYLVRAIRLLFGLGENEPVPAEQFRRSYVSADGRYVALLDQQFSTWVVDIQTELYLVDASASPRGFEGGFLELEGETRLDFAPSWCDENRIDLRQPGLPWQRCPAVRR